jgi:hypothetical protein
MNQTLLGSRRNITAIANIAYPGLLIDTQKVK